MQQQGASDKAAAAASLQLKPRRYQQELFEDALRGNVSEQPAPCRWTGNMPACMFPDPLALWMAHEREVPLNMFA